MLQGAFDDRMHQPYREKLLPRLLQVIDAGGRAGALGGFLSGSGSSILCLTTGREEAVARAMQRQLPESEMMILSVDGKGCQVIRRD